MARMIYRPNWSILPWKQKVTSRHFGIQIRCPAIIDQPQSKRIAVGHLYYLGGGVITVESYGIIANMVNCGGTRINNESAFGN